ncbi:MAG TPA: NAD-dependent epimerase/dehydratase family protein [Gemmatimonadales bacterium]
MRVLVTGANGFVGRWLVRHLGAAGHEVVGLSGPGQEAGPARPEGEGISWRSFDLDDPASVAAGLDPGADAVVHLAGVASVAESLVDPARAWQVNALGTVRLLEVLAARRARGVGDPVVLLVSTGEVYGRSDRAHGEDEAPSPISPYAASKAAAELAGLETWRRTGLRVVVARPFPHTGPGQSTRFVVPALLRRVREARREGRGEIAAGDLSPVRDFLDVRDVVAAYTLLLARGRPGRTYNVASGTGVRLDDLLGRIAGLLGHPVRAVTDPALVRPADIPVLVGDAGRLRSETGWRPAHALDDTLRRMLDAETD